MPDPQNSSDKASEHVGREPRKSLEDDPSANSLAEVANRSRKSNSVNSKGTQESQQQSPSLAFLLSTHVPKTQFEHAKEFLGNGIASNDDNSSTRARIPHEKAFSVDPEALDIALRELGNVSIHGPTVSLELLESSPFLNCPAPRLH
ncbi:hypothetical protein GH714_024061 [Hevea brasiliensis]|uniref:Uncharacterized protein n=1 Tax=Hevea brasiliensis TaxID=3981 RepID=A0A6A6LDL2_HEVBR|nr:hypothetical protein GH714_024061 [Hevea brasiliensis]